VIVALSSSAIAEIVLSAVLACFLVGHLVRRRRRIPLSWLTVRNGRVALTDKGRVRASNRGMEIGVVEASLAETFYVDEDGDIAYGGAGRDDVNSEAEEK
jgi:hypothetical protein